MWLPMPPRGGVKRYLSALGFEVLVGAPLWLATAFLETCLGLGRGGGERVKQRDKISEGAARKKRAFQ